MSDDLGAVADIKKIEDLPAKIFDAMLEGLAKKPAEFVVLGMGFLLGYEGQDIMAYIMRPFTDMIKSITSLKLSSGTSLTSAVATGLGNQPALQYPVSTIAVQMGFGWNDLVKAATGVAIFPNKHITPASKLANELPPGVSYYGAAPEGFQGDWPPYGTTLAELEDKIRNAKNDGKPTAGLSLEQWAAEFKIKVLLGCVGALTAYTLSRPGVAQTLITEIGDTVQAGIRAMGEAVPL